MEKCAIVKEWPLVDQPVPLRLVHYANSTFVGQPGSTEVLFATCVMGPSGGYTSRQHDSTPLL